ncbi:unnamed protein product [Symbiodinium natans]|uniref:Uncharacterized protein n=1 Tax=Symbiodinium natans TaxID=878477 RepID=A0A812KBN8_9DINO|nr:unnamed protein product [Symbiodinium natans]
MSVTSKDEDWFSWASRLKVGDGLWYQRCEGTPVKATVEKICLTSRTCWVQYQVQPLKGGRQNRRALVKVEELMRVQQDQERLSSVASSIASEVASEQGSICEAGWASEGYTPTMAETMPAHRSLRSRGLSMVVSEDEDVVGARCRPQRAYSMVVEEEEEPQRRTATSMIFDDLESLDMSPSRTLPRHAVHAKNPTQHGQRDAGELV